jgi:hypothetical protein
MQAVSPRNTIISAFFSFCGVAILSLTGCAPQQSEVFKKQDLALMAMVRCLVTGGHMTKHEGAMFVAQIVKEQSGQFQHVYDAISTGVSEETNQQVENNIKSEGGCRDMLSRFAGSEPETPFKKSIELDWTLKSIKYFDEK